MWAYCWTKFFTLNNESIESSKWEGQHASFPTHWGLLHGQQQTHCSENMNGWSRTASCRVVRLVCVLHQRSHQELCRGLVHLVAWQLDIGDARCCLGDRVRGCMNLHARQNSGTAACNHHSWISPVSPYLPSAACPPNSGLRLHMLALYSDDVDVCQLWVWLLCVCVRLILWLDDRLRCRFVDLICDWVNEALHMDSFIFSRRFQCTIVVCDTKQVE